LPSRAALRSSGNWRDGLAQERDRLSWRYRKYHCAHPKFCRQTGDRVVASAALVNRLELPFGITKRPLGDLHLRGKETDVVLYALQKGRAAGAAAAA
jgi:hypothetical protein